MSTDSNNTMKAAAALTVALCAIDKDSAATDAGIRNAVTAFQSAWGDVDEKAINRAFARLGGKGAFFTAISDHAGLSGKFAAAMAVNFGGIVNSTVDPDAAGALVKAPSSREAIAAGLYAMEIAIRTTGKASGKGLTALPWDNAEKSAKSKILQGLHPAQVAGIDAQFTAVRAHLAGGNGVRSFVARKGTVLSVLQVHLSLLLDGGTIPRLERDRVSALQTSEYTGPALTGLWRFITIGADGAAVVTNAADGDDTYDDTDNDA